MSRNVRLFACLVGPWVMAASGQYNVLTFHGDRQRTGWIWSERILTTRSVSGGTYGPVWNSPQFDPVTIGGKTYPAHVYASPLYVERVTLSGGDFAGRTLSVVYAASSNGFVWASGGPAIDDRGNLYATTGNGPVDIASAPGYWGQSVLVWAPGLPLRLVGTYTPGNYWQMEKADIDLAGGAAIVLPDLGEANKTTPRLITQAFGVGPRRGPIQEKRGQR